MINNFLKIDKLKYLINFSLLIFLLIIIQKKNKEKIAANTFQEIIDLSALLNSDTVNVNSVRKIDEILSGSYNLKDKLDLKLEQYGKDILSFSKDFHLTKAKADALLHKKEDVEYTIANKIEERKKLYNAFHSSKCESKINELRTHTTKSGYTFTKDFENHIRSEIPHCKTLK